MYPYIERVRAFGPKRFRSSCKSHDRALLKPSTASPTDTTKTDVFPISPPDMTTLTFSSFMKSPCSSLDVHSINIASSLDKELQQFHLPLKRPLGPFLLGSSSTTSPGKTSSHKHDYRANAALSQVARKSEFK